MTGLLRPIGGDTRHMNTTAPTLIRPGLMWRLYIAAWTTYGVFISFADQLDWVVEGRFDAGRWLLTFVSLLPSALLLALAWPLTGFFERRGYRLTSIIGIHILRRRPVLRGVQGFSHGASLAGFDMPHCSCDEHR